MIENNKHYSADQLNFIRMVESVFSQKKHITYADFWEPPFITLGNAPEPMFSKDELDSFVGFVRGFSGNSRQGSGFGGGVAERVGVEEAGGCL